MIKPKPISTSYNQAPCLSIASDASTPYSVPFSYNSHSYHFTIDLIEMRCVNSCVYISGRSILYIL